MIRWLKQSTAMDLEIYDSILEDLDVVVDGFIDVQLYVEASEEELAIKTLEKLQYEILKSCVS